jgi:hypothetical protein
MDISASYENYFFLKSLQHFISTFLCAQLVFSTYDWFVLYSYKAFHCCYYHLLSAINLSIGFSSSINQCTKRLVKNPLKLALHTRLSEDDAVLKIAGLREVF